VERSDTHQSEMRNFTTSDAKITEIKPDFLLIPL